MPRKTNAATKPRRTRVARPEKSRKGAGTAKSKAKSKAKGNGSAAEKKLSRVRKPEQMSLEEWQVGLRRQFGREQPFGLKNVGDERLFSEYAVTNPATGGTYQVVIRGSALGENYCSCPDFAVNTLGTCKHVEFVLGRLERKRGAKAALALGYAPPFSEVYLQYGAQREVVFRPGTKCPAALATSARRYFDAQGRLKPEAFGRFHTFLKRARSTKHEIRCQEDVLGFVAQVRDASALSRAVDGTFKAGARSAAFKALIKASLYGYQRFGALFAAKTGRCLIADDMGLGKTIQALAAAEMLAQTRGLERVLVISPTSLKHQWKREIEKFTDREALVIEGLFPKRAQLYQSEAFYKLVNYDVVYRDLDLIRRFEPELIILDEAQRIKNWKTRTAQSVKQLESPYAFVLTGTPLENRLEELHSIVEFVDRFRLGPMFRFLAAHQHVDETGRVVGYRNLSGISETLKPILIRRTKEEVLPELPERMEKQFFVPMTDQQRVHHDENREIVARIVAKWRRYGFLSEPDQRRLMIAMQNMRMSCNSTYLLDKETDHGVKADEVIDLLSDALEDPSSKVVIFSQWVRMHELVARRLDDRKIKHVLFHGRVPGPKRKHLIREFKDDPECRLFLSTDAGGVGLNLQNASTVVNLDQPWNPAVLEQRIGRVHRLGQHRPVRVLHLISQGTIEEGMLSLLKFKTALFTGVLDGGRDEVFLGGTRLKRFMESVERATGTIPEAMPAVSPTRLEPVENDPGTASQGAAAEGPHTPGAVPQSNASEDDRMGREPDEAAAGNEPPSGEEAAWNDVVSSGLALLEKLGSALSRGQQGQKPGAVQLPSQFVARDESTGRPCLKLPLPEPETIEKIADLFAAFAGRK